ncbi:CDGSH iron-sulfur domain-containing protein [Mycolicibacterium baixiangningiae]|uniref:CDGSH iron-sulfur domain-containing protein n=1 Tax=Mycolicibacterium baixiangningiae TaxID=2761578 RepID=UPI001E4C5D98|nr:CDGSH iron-sulfur domain-containing protein [Mycolicibacterium baixiangningiae]
MTEPRTVRVVQGGPIMVQGPVRIELPDGSVVESDRFMVAICACKRSKTYPLCDTSHRRRRRGDDDPSPSSAPSGQRSA